MTSVAKRSTRSVQAPPKAPPPAKHPHRQWAPDATALNLIGDKWTLLIIRELVAGPVRFVQLQRQLDGISTEQLRSRLNRMVRDGLLSRERYREVPPRVDYALTDKGRAALPVVAELARFGLAFAWDEPTAEQRVRIASIFRLVSVLADAPATGRHTTMALVVQDEGARERYMLTFEDGERRLERVAEDVAGELVADVVLSGTVAEWVAALAPGGSTDALRVTTRTRRADGAGVRLLEQLTGR
jgi:DNA-binding HxlR family transcriptional regulator